jgi:tetratricopeptide (TPR) repeat protein
LVTRYRADLALTHYQIGDRQLYFRRFADALVSLDQARVLAEPLVREAPQDYLMKIQLGAILEGRGRVLAELGRFNEAVAAYQEAIPQARQACDQAPASPLHRRVLAADLVHTYEGLAELLQTMNRPEEALQALHAAREVLEMLPDLQSWDLQLAQLDSQASALAGQGEPYAERAISLLRSEIAAGRINLLHLKSERRLDPLRSRPDFQMLQMDLAFPGDPFRPETEPGLADRHAPRRAAGAAR